MANILDKLRRKRSRADPAESLRKLEDFFKESKDELEAALGKDVGFSKVMVVRRDITKLVGLAILCAGVLIGGSVVYFFLDYNIGKKTPTVALVESAKIIPDHFSANTVDGASHKVVVDVPVVKPEPEHQTPLRVAKPKPKKTEPKKKEQKDIASSVSVSKPAVETLKPETTVTILADTAKSLKGEEIKKKRPSLLRRLFKKK